MIEPTTPALLRPQQAAEWLGCSVSSLYRAVRLGRLAAVKPFGAGELRFRQADLAAFVAELEPVNSEAGSAAKPAPRSLPDAGPGRLRPLQAGPVR